MSFSRIRDKHPGLATRLDIIVIYSILLNTRKLINERKGLCVRFNYHVERNRWARNTDWENVIISEKHKLRNESLKKIPSTVGTFAYVYTYCILAFSYSASFVLLFWMAERLDERIKNVECFVHGNSGINLDFIGIQPSFSKKYVHKIIRAINKRFSSLWYIISMIRTYIIKPYLKSHFVYLYAD